MRAFAASDDMSLSFQLRDTLVRLGHECPASHVVSLDSAPSRLSSLMGSSESTGQEILFVVLVPDLERAINTLQELKRKLQKPIFAIGPVDDPKQILHILREGAREYLDQDDLSTELTAALDRLSAENQSQQSSGRAIMLLPGSGGCGCSTLSVNLATALAQSVGSCILVDANPESGDLAPLLDLKPAYTTADMCQRATRLDRSLLEGGLTVHSSGVKLLAGPLRIADSDHVTAEGIKRIISLSRDLTPFIVVDLPHMYRSAPIQTLAQADEILLVFRLDFTSLRNIRRLLDYLEETGLNTEAVRLVVNRSRQPGELGIADAESALNRKIYHSIPDDPKTANRAGNNGVPFVLQSPSAKISSQVTALATLIQQSSSHSKPA